MPFARKAIVKLPITADLNLHAEPPLRGSPPKRAAHHTFIISVPPVAADAVPVLIRLNNPKSPTTPPITINVIYFTFFTDTPDNLAASEHAPTALHCFPYAVKLKIYAPTNETKIITVIFKPLLPHFNMETGAASVPPSSKRTRIP